jgi:uncharacterized membrane protein YphA (DoxX/SURF4 family)
MAAVSLRHVPGRLAAGAFTLHAGIEKLSAEPEHAAGIHGMAAGTYPFLADIPPERFVRALAIGEIVLGGALLAPVVPTRVAGAALTAFSAGLLGLYAKTPGMRKPGSVWPSPQGIGLSKDVWLLAIGAALALDDAVGDR